MKLVDWRGEKFHSFPYCSRSPRRRRGSHCFSPPPQSAGPAWRWAGAAAPPPRSAGCRAGLGWTGGLCRSTAPSLCPSSDSEQTEITIVLISRLVRTAVSACERKLCKLTNQPKSLHTIASSVHRGANLPLRTCPPLLPPAPTCPRTRRLPRSLHDRKRELVSVHGTITTAVGIFVMIITTTVKCKTTIAETLVKVAGSQQRAPPTARTAT